MTTPIVSPVERVERSGVFVPQSFVPYVEKHFDEEYVIVDKLGESEPVFRQNREFLEFYLNECKRYVSHILRKIEQPSFVQQTIVPTVVPRTLEQQLEALKIVPTTTVVPQYKSLVEVLLTVLGVRDINRICEQTVTLGELGLDTVLAQELRQLFEQVYQFPVQFREIPQLTVEKIRMIESRYPQGINELYLPRPLTYLPRLRSVIRKTIF